MEDPGTVCGRSPLTSGPAISSKAGPTTGEGPHAQRSRRVQPRMSGDPARPQARPDRRARRAVHPPRRARPHAVRQRAGVHCDRAQGLPRRGRARCAVIAPGSPGENGCCESITSKLRDELLNGEIFYSLTEARIGDRDLAPAFTTRRSHSSPGDRSPARRTLQWRPRHAHLARPPPQPWRRDLSCIETETGPFHGGRQACCLRPTRTLSDCRTDDSR
ncbi:hypothetical protein EYE35_12725 [Cereibacter sphaeroides]|nr:hypothetical protein EYE35_12725 [Cereibacter sphaeroides]